MKIDGEKDDVMYRISVLWPRLLGVFVFLSFTLHSCPENRLHSETEPECGSMSRIRVSEDGTHFVKADSRERFVVWGVNYDHDRQGRLLDEYWLEDWEAIVQDFREIRDLGANCVRVHLQLGIFMDSPDLPNAVALAQLKKLVQLAERSRLYLNITGLACYHKENVPAWYDAMEEQERWQVQAHFWESVAAACESSPAIFCFDLMNEPIVPGGKRETEWLTGELGGKFFVQRIALDAAGRDRKEIAAAWVAKLTRAIRKQDSNAMLTVGVIPWVFVFGGGSPLFYSEEVGGPLDFVSVHFYPEAGEIDKALNALQKYEIGKPLVIEEIFPLRSGIAEAERFIERSSDYVDGWISFYWGETAAELRSRSDNEISSAVVAKWLETWKRLGASVIQKSAVRDP